VLVSHCYACSTAGYAYREDNVDKVHNGENDNANLGMVVTVRQKHEGGGEDVMGKHLRIVLALLLDVDHKELLDPKTPLN
jgi:hypothetical protein